MPSVFLAIPTLSNRVTIQICAFVDALRRTSMEPEAGFGFHYAIENGRSPVEYARNLLVGAFLRSDCDRILFIDEDMMPEATVARLLHTQADIACARMYKWDHADPERGTDVGLGLCAMKRKDDTPLHHPLMPSVGDPAIQDCDAVGTACTLIKRHVLEDRRLWADNVYTNAEGQTFDGNLMPEKGDFAPNVFQYRRAPNGMGIVGEDVDFCMRAKALGYSIQVDLNAVCGHFKTIDIDQAGFLVQRSMAKAVAGIRMDDGSIVKVDLASAIAKVADPFRKDLTAPPMDKAVHAGDFAAKAS